MSAGHYRSIFRAELEVHLFGPLGMPPPVGVPA
jgi:hypothetical protein